MYIYVYIYIYIYVLYRRSLLINLSPHIHVCIYILHRGKKTLNSLGLNEKRRATGPVHELGSTSSSHRSQLQVSGY